MHQEFDPRDLEPALPTRTESTARSKVAPILIALVALAGFGGVVWYAYDQGVRQSAPPGVAPFIKAEGNPTKVRPEQPGGMEVPHQNMQVLNQLPEGDKTGAAPVERLLPPPETPLPRPTDTTAASAPAPAGSVPLPPKIGPTPPASAVTTPIASAPAAAPAPAAPAPTAGTPTTGAQTASAPAAFTAPTPASTPAPAPPAKTQTATAQVPPPKPTPAASGSGFRVQLVSVRSQDQTAQEWARLQHAFPELAPLHMSVTRVDLGEKGVWYRIFGGPLSDAASAGLVCGAIKAKDSKQGCLVVKP